MDADDDPARAEVRLGETLQPWLPRAPFVAALRAALDRRQAPPMEIIRSRGSDAIHCLACVEAAAASLGLRHEPVEPIDEERSRLEPYALVTSLLVGHRQAASAIEDADRRIVAAEGLPAASARVSFWPDSRYGLFRLVPAGASTDELLYYWSCEFDEGDSDALHFATRRRATFERFLAAAEVRHAIHERARRGVIVVGEHTSHRAFAEAVAWDDVLLPPAMREELERTVRDFFASGELYRRHGIVHRRGILLAGPPGNGKTTILKAIASTAGVPLVVATGALDEGHRHTLIEHAFARAASLAPAVLCFEDLDALLADDGPALSFFLNLLDGLEPLEGVLVVATTNRPDRIDPAIAHRPSRFDRVFAIEPPDRSLREVYFDRALRGAAPPGAAGRLAARTEGLSVAFLKEIVVQARFAALRRGDERMGETDLELGLGAVREHVHLAVHGLEKRGDAGFRAKRG